MRTDRVKAVFLAMALALAAGAQAPPPAAPPAAKPSTPPGAAPAGPAPAAQPPAAAPAATPPAPAAPPPAGGAGGAPKAPASTIDIMKNLADAAAGANQEDFIIKKPGELTFTTGVVIEGRVEKPQVMLVLSKEALRLEPVTFEKSFLDNITRPLQYNVFEFLGEEKKEMKEPQALNQEQKQEPKQERKREPKPEKEQRKKK